VWHRTTASKYLEQGPPPGERATEASVVTETWQSEIVAMLAKFLRLQVVDATPSTLRDTAVDPARVGRALRWTDVQVLLRDLSIRSDHDVDIGALLADQTGVAVDEHGDAVVPRVPSGERRHLERPRGHLRVGGVQVADSDRLAQRLPGAVLGQFVSDPPVLVN
jgi:hypothetical protein